ncbi:Rieske (2Fe-2S) protein [Cellulomonas sp. McL0617]|uniref:Rieske (2Fe-2S) protein n=1 Tax=Cellulomonas sp. McL0617 TaxID=3415675 RepID=UPI003CE7E598
MDGPGRRAVLEGTGVVVAAGVVGFVGYHALAPPPGTGPVAYPAAPQDHARSSTGSGDAPLAALSDVPDGGGLVVTDQKVVIARAGPTVHAFTAVCTHMGCLVRDVRGGEIHCPCHGSAFDATTGAVVQGPATRPLEAVDVVVRDGEVIRT